MTSTRHGKPRVLLVDDHRPNLDALAAILNGGDYVVERAGSAAQALKCVMDRDFAVILLDVLMPDCDGFECARLIKLRRRSSATPIIFLTAAAADPGQAFRGYDAGAVDYIVKPLEAAVVRAKVQFFVQLFRATAALREEIETMRAVCAALESEANQTRNDISRYTAELHEFIACCEQRLVLLTKPTAHATARDLEQIDAMAKALLDT